MVHEVGLSASKFFQLPGMNRNVLGRCGQIVPEILDELELLGWTKIEDGRATHRRCHLVQRYNEKARSSSFDSLYLKAVGPAKRRSHDDRSARLGRPGVFPRTHGDRWSSSRGGQSLASFRPQLRFDERVTNLRDLCHFAFQQGIAFPKFLNLLSKGFEFAGDLPFLLEIFERLDCSSHFTAL